MNEDPKKPAEAGASETPAAEEQAADQERASLEAQLSEGKDRLLRTLAEMENLRRRTERDVRDARQYAVTAFALDVLSVADNLRRALDAVPEDAAAEGTPVATLVEGVGLTERDLLNTLEKHGVRKVEALGVKFDPNVHQAVFEVPDPEAPHGTVVQVMQEGFLIGERVLRPAMVAVAKGGPKAQPAAASAASDRSSEPAPPESPARPESKNG